jgi:hypothetical protein
MNAGQLRRRLQYPTDDMRNALMLWIDHGEAVARASLPDYLTAEDLAWFNAWIVRNEKAIRAARMIQFGGDGWQTVERGPFISQWKGRHRA